MPLRLLDAGEQLSARTADDVRMSSAQTADRWSTNRVRADPRQATALHLWH